jgi:hypothetical protein
MEAHRDPDRALSFDVRRDAKLGLLKALRIEVPKLLRHAYISRSYVDDSRRFSPSLWAHDELDHRLEIAAQPIELLREDTVGLTVRKALEGYPRLLGRILLRLLDRDGLRDTERAAGGALLRVLRVAAAESEKKDGEERPSEHPHDWTSSEREWFPYRYSSRNASIGSTFVARRPGR